MSLRRSLGLCFALLLGCSSSGGGGKADGSVKDSGSDKDGSQTQDTGMPGQDGATPADGGDDGNTPGTTYKDYVYVASGQRIYRYEIVAGTGALTELGYTSVGSNGVEALASSADGKFLYTNVGSTHQARGYSIDATTGDLTDLGAIAVDDNAVAMAVDATGNWLLTTYFSANKASVYGINDSGALVAGAAATLNTANEPHEIILSADNKYVFIPSRNTSRVYQFLFNQNTGALTANSPAYVASEDGGGARHIAFHPNDQLAYVVNEFGNSVTVFSYDDGTGKLTRESTVSALPNGTNEMGMSGADINVTPDGKYLYASIRGHNSVAMFTINTGAKTITRIGNQSTEAKPRDMGMDHDGRFLYVAGQDSGKVAAYAINNGTGVLTYINHYNAGSAPEWVEPVHVAQPAP